MLKDQKEWLGHLNEYGIEYMVVGGHAVDAHAEPRLWNRRTQRQIEPGLDNNFISLRGLSRYPLAVGRLQDLADVESLRKMNGLD